LAIAGSPVQDHHHRTYGELPYDAFVEAFLAGLVTWDPAPWADLFAQAGARYVVLVTKHHDGVLLWPSAAPNPFRGKAWQSERDVVGELADAVRSRGMRFGTYYSGGLDWTFGGMPITDLSSLIAAIPQSSHYLAHADGHWRELIERYQPDVLWNDIGYPAAADLQTLFAFYYERVPEGVVNNRFDFQRQTSGDIHCDFLTPEYSTDADPSGRKWETCRGIGTSFGYNAEETESDYLSAKALTVMLSDVTSRGGNLLLNVGPMADGTIPATQVDRLQEIGRSLRAHPLNVR
jgi:alpha-L-fucosidase